MKTLAAVSIHQYERAAEALADYNRTIELGFQIALTGQTRSTETTISRGFTAAIVFGSDQGMCGQFNEQVVSRLNTKAADEGSDRSWTILRLETVRRSIDRFRLERPAHLQPADVRFQRPTSSRVASRYRSLDDNVRDRCGLVVFSIVAHQRLLSSRTTCNCCHWIRPGCSVFARKVWKDRPRRYLLVNVNAWYSRLRTTVSVRFALSRLCRIAGKRECESDCCHASCREETSKSDWRN